MDLNGKSFELSQDEAKKVAILQKKAVEFLDMLGSTLPDGRAKSIAIIYFETSLMWASNSVMETKKT